MTLGNQNLRDAIGSLMNARPGDLVCKYTTAGTVIAKVLPRQTVRLSPFKEMNDPRETEGGRFKCNDFVGDKAPPDSFEMERRFGENLRDLASVFCATRDDNERDRNVVMRRGFGRSRMWAQYGDDHKGACLVFDRSLLQDAAQAALGEQRLWQGNVEYDRAALDAGARAFNFDYQEFRAAPIDYLVGHADKWRLSLFFRKHEDWKGESEWRMATIASEASEQGGCCVHYGAALKYVVLGHRVNADTIGEIGQLFDGPVLRLRYEQWREDCVLNITEEPC